MKRVLLFFTILIITNSINAQNRNIARGAEPGELYITGEWYGIYGPFGGHVNLFSAIYRLTENGKKLTIQYDIDYCTSNIYDMRPGAILADATLGVLYNRQLIPKNDGYTYTQLYASFDYGKSWVLREENIGSRGYSSGMQEGTIYTGVNTGGSRNLFQSKDYGESFNFYFDIPIPYSSGLPSYKECEFFGLGGGIKHHELHYTNNCANSFIVTPIDSQYVYTDFDVYLGGLQGEVYVTSRFPDWTYQVSFSADTGYTFRKVFISESYNPWDYAPIFMSDREPGVFYIIRSYMEEDLNPWGEHKKLCVYYYRDYGETLVDIYCHDITKNYGSTCEAVTDLALEKCSNNCILLSWSEPESSLPVEKYQVYRNNVQITNCELRENTYLDENLSAGEYEYYVVTHYTTGCVSDTSNHVAESVELGVKGVKELGGVRLFPNPTTGELQVTSYELQVTSIEIFDVYGRQLSSHHLITPSSHHKINISELQAGIYFVRITTEKGVVIKKVVKM